MTYRPLGRSGLVVSAVGLGCNDFGARLDPGATRAVVDAAIECGITLFDTADVYGQGASEELLGRVLGGRRATTSSWPRSSAWTCTAPTARLRRRAARAGTSQGGRGHPAPAAHRLDRPLPVPLPRPGMTPVEETLAALDDLVDRARCATSALQFRAAGRSRRRVDRRPARLRRASSARKTSTACSIARPRPRWCPPASASGVACCRSSRWQRPAHRQVPPREPPRGHAPAGPGEAARTSRLRRLEAVAAFAAARHRPPRRRHRRPGGAAGGDEGHRRGHPARAGRAQRGAGAWSPRRTTSPSSTPSPRRPEALLPGGCHDESTARGGAVAVTGRCVWPILPAR